MSEVEFKVGDIVVLKSVEKNYNSDDKNIYPLMTIVAKYNNGNFECVWFNTLTHEFKLEKNVNKECLKKRE